VPRPWRKNLLPNNKSTYEKIISLTPEILTLPVGQGVRLRLRDNFELHANLRHQGEDDELILGFYRTGGSAFKELASYEIMLNHLAKIARVSVIRQEGKLSLTKCFAQIAGLPVQSRALIALSGSSPSNEQLYSAIRDIAPRLDEAEFGGLIAKESTLQRGFDIYVLANGLVEAVLEISPIGIDGLSTMTVALDKERKTAGVVEISGAAGRYPFYLPYPDGKEMPPVERDAFSRMLYDWLQEKTGKTKEAPCPQINLHPE